MIHFDEHFSDGLKPPTRRSATHLLEIFYILFGGKIPIFNWEFWGGKIPICITLR